MARIVGIDAKTDWLDQALAELKAGRPVAIPTETVYGLAADASNGLAVANIFALKGRPSFNPLICHVDGIAMAKMHGELNEAALALADAFWPGPLTLVVPKLASSTVHELATAGLGTIGLRMPSGPAGKLIAAFGKPVAAPSANRSGKLSPTTAAHVAREFADTDLLILDGGPCRVGIESTIVKCVGGEFAILRPGLLTAPEVESVAGSRLSKVAGTAVEAPGMLASHYAPNAPLRTETRDCPRGAALLAFGDGADRDRRGAKIVLNLSPSGDLREAAANLYGFLQRLDASGPAEICVEPIPNEGIGVAINDRLTRAAAPRVEAYCDG